MSTKVTVEKPPTARTVRARLRAESRASGEDSSVGSEPVTTGGTEVVPSVEARKASTPGGEQGDSPERTELVTSGVTDVRDSIIPKTESDGSSGSESYQSLDTDVTVIPDPLGPRVEPDLTLRPVNWADDYEIERAASIERVKSAEIGELPQWKERYPDLIWKPSNRTLSDTDVPVSLPELADDPKLKEIKGRIEESHEKGRQIQEELVQILKEREERNLKIQQLEKERIAEMNKILEESVILEDLTAQIYTNGATKVVENPFTVTEPTTPVLTPVIGPSEAKSTKGKTIDPRNWGGVDLAEEELSIGQQEQLLSHFKESSYKVPQSKFDDLKDDKPRVKLETSKVFMGDTTKVKPEESEVKRVRVKTENPGNDPSDSDPGSDHTSDSEPERKTKRQLKRELKDLKAYLRRFSDPHRAAVPRRSVERSSVEPLSAELADKLAGDGHKSSGK
ncbi:hypothetical protein H0H93_005064, partial [Arthromyces matolae]